MKKIGNVLSELTLTTELCKQAILEASKGKRKHGTVRYALRNIETAAEKLRSLILSGNYKPNNYKPCEIIDHPSGKRRVLHKPIFYPDQCIHHVTILLTEKYLLNRLDPYCIGSVPGRGQAYGHRAIKRWLANDRKGTKYCAKCDIKKCYDSITPRLIVDAFSKIFKDRRYLELIRTIAYGHESLPLGNYTSAWFMNIILLIIDHVARGQPSTKHYLRYIDDFIIFGSNKRKLHATVSLIMQSLKPLGLKVKENWQVFPTAVRGVDILGYRYFPTHVLLRKRNALSTRRQAVKIVRMQNQNKRIPYETAAGFLSRIGQLKHCSSFNFRTKHVNKIKINKLKDVIRSGKDRDNRNTSKRYRSKPVDRDGTLHSKTLP